MNQAPQSQNKDTTPNPLNDLWSFLKEAFSFFDKVLQILQKDTQLAALWGLAVLLVVVIVVTFALARDIPPLAKAGLVIFIVIVLALLFIYSLLLRADPRKVYPQLDDIKKIASLHQQLENLIHLEGYLRAVQTAFGPCVEVVTFADNNWHKIQFTMLEQNWRPVRQNQVAALCAFVQVVLIQTCLLKDGLLDLINK